MADPARLRAQEAEVARLQAELAAARARESDIYREQRQVNSELRAIKATIQDPNASLAEKTRLTERGVELEGQFNRLEREGLQQNQRVQTLESQARAAESELRGLQQVASPPQGPNTESAGQTITEASQARADGANTQAPPPAAEQSTEDGQVEPQPQSITPTNAVPTQAAVPTQSTPPSKIPGASNVQDAAAATTAAGGTPTQFGVDSGLLQPRQQSSATQSFIYKAIMVTSVFDKGRFTQDIEGALMIFPLPIRGNSQATAPQATAQQATAPQATTSQTSDAFQRGPDQNESETRRLSAANEKARFSGRTLADRQQQASITLREARAGRAFTGESKIIGPGSSSPPTSGGRDVGLRNQQIEQPQGNTQTQQIVKDQ